MTLYDVLGVESDASLTEIKKAYKKRAAIYHPDRNEGSIEYKEKFQEIQEAYSVLKDPLRRKKYDDTGSTETGPSPRDVAYTVISSLFIRFLQENNYVQKDYVHSVVNELKRTRRTCLGELEFAKDKLKRFCDILTHLKVPEEIQEILDGEEARLKQNVHQVESSLGSVDIALEIIEDCKYSGEDNPNLLTCTRMVMTEGTF